MMKKPVSSVTKLSIQQLEKLIRERSQNSENVIFTSHVKSRMRKRKITFLCASEVLLKGSISRTPEPNPNYGTLECRMEHFVAGHDIAIIVAISDIDPGLVVITAMVI